MTANRSFALLSSCVVYCNPALSTLQKNYLLLDPNKFNYKIDFPKEKTKWEKLVTEMPLIAQYPEMIAQTLKQAEKTEPGQARRGSITWRFAASRGRSQVTGVRSQKWQH